MMLTEAAGKQLLRSAAIPTPAGSEVTSWADAEAHELPPFPVAVKAQVASGGRGKAGGVVRCDSPGALRAGLEHVLGLEFNGERALTALVEPWLAIERELYLSLVVDSRADGFRLLYAPDGGVDIESSHPIADYPFGRLADYRGHQLRRALAGVEDDLALVEKLVRTAGKLVRLASASECTTVEINPLAILADGALVAADAKVVLDDAAGFRNHFTEQALREARRHETGAARACRAANLAYVQLDGTVGLISGGAGMTMSAMDTIADAGLRAACFLDISGNPTPAGLTVALQALTGPDTEAVLVSIFGGGLFVDRIARSLLELLQKADVAKPVTFRLAGAGAADATRILQAAGQVNHATLEGAVTALARQLGAHT
jgi:succinyl-CoA synthetase beta subunit